MKFSIIADDNTGASDAAGMLTQNGVSSLLIFDLKKAAELKNNIKKYDSVVIGTQIRSAPPQIAYKKTTDAINFLKKFNVKKIQLKYCSTFDSTKKGNIGQSLDASLSLLRLRSTIVCPALPVNNRTVYNGYLFVNGTLLSESSMRNHPLNPMTESKLEKWLAHQTDKKIKSINLSKIREGALSLKKYLNQLSDEGVNYFIMDTIDQKDLKIIADATRDFPFISGASGITTEISKLLFKKKSVLVFNNKLKKIKKGILVISGSLSPATAEQNQLAIDQGFEDITIDASDILNDKFQINSVIKKASSILNDDNGVIIRTKINSTTDTKKIHLLGKKIGLTEIQTGEKIGKKLSEIAKKLSTHPNLGKLIVSGGETSGAVCKTLGFTAFEVGLPIDPGVPYCFPLSNPSILVVLKSGNFGSKDLYLKVQKL